MIKYNGFLLDMDGVLYKDSEIIQSAVDAVNTLKLNNKKVFFMTNNSTRLPSEYQSRLTEIGVNNVKEEEIITSGTVTADYLKECLVKNPEKKEVLCVTKRAVGTLLRNVGLNVTLLHELDPEKFSEDLYKKFHYVVSAEAQYRDPNHPEDRLLTLASLDLPVNAIKHYGAKFIGTNPDVTDPAPDGRSKPVAGALLAYIRAASGIEPTVVGKPEPQMYKEALKRMQIEASELLVIGDRLDTDIKGALDLKIDATLVETGTHTKNDIGRLGISPTYVFSDLSELLTAE